jgi:DNA-binding transcriptional LysR family regulator
VHNEGARYSISVKTMKPGAGEFDLNLLRVLVALDDSRSVTQAALALNMSQSGFSTALGRLRVVFDDALFVRSARGMLPTPRAQALVQTARPVLASVMESVLGPPVFDPATMRTEFRLAMSDVAEIIYLPKLLRHLAVHAPHCNVRTASLGTQALVAALEAGDVDLAVGYFPDLNSQAFFKQRLYTHTYACMVRRDHAVVADGLSQDVYGQLGHAVVTSPARSNELFDAFLAEHRIERRIVFSTPHHLSLPAIVEATDLLATVPLATGVHFARLGNVRLVRLPFAPPRFAVQQHWHRLVHHDERSRWLRSQIALLFDESSDEWRQVEQALYGDLPASAGQATPRSRIAKSRSPAGSARKP